MFYGEYAHTLDDKGRLTLPAKLRGELEEGVVVTRGLDGCLFIFTQEDWEKFRASVGERLSFTQKSARQFSRFQHQDCGFCIISVIKLLIDFLAGE